MKILQQILITTVCLMAVSIRSQTNQWMPLKNIGTTLTGTSATLPAAKEAVSLQADGKIFIIGSVSYTSNTNPTVAVVYQYNQSDDSWTQKADYPGSGIFALVGFAIGNYLYAGGGRHTPGGDDSDFYRYDIATDTWSAIASMPLNTSASSCFVIGGKGYVCCGTVPNMSSGGTHLLEYDPALNSWTQKAAFPGTGRYVASAFSIGNNGYVGLGYGSSTTFSDFYKYTPATDSWQQISSMPGSARNSALACVVNNQGIILCGNKGMTTFNDSYVYDPIDDSWDPFISFSAGSRSAMVGGVIGNTIFAGGGGGPGGTSTFTDWQKNETTVGLNKIHRPKSQPRIVRSTSRDWLLEVPLSANKTNEFTICDLSGKQLTKSQIYDTAVWLPEFMDGLYIIYFDNPAWAPIKFIGGR